MNFFTFLSDLQAPLIIVLMVLYLRYRFKIKSLKAIYQSVYWGLFPIILVVVVHLLFELAGFQIETSIKKTLLYVFVAIAFSAEFGKFIPIRLSLFHLKTFEGPISGIIYSSFVSVAYSSVIVILAMIGFFGGFLGDNQILFLWTYPLVNLFLGIIQGFFIGMQRVKSTAMLDEITGLGIATGLHLVYFFSLIANDHLLFTVTIAGLLLIAFFLIRKSVLVPARTL